MTEEISVKFILWIEDDVKFIFNIAFIIYKFNLMFNIIKFYFNKTR